MKENRRASNEINKAKDAMATITSSTLMKAKDTKRRQS